MSQFFNLSKGNEENPAGTLVYVYVENAMIRVDYGRTCLCITPCSEIAWEVADIACERYNTVMSPKSRSILEAL